MIERVRHFVLRVKGRWVFGRPVAVFGDFTVVNPKRVTIGSNCAINHGVFILGHTKIEIGDDVVLSARCMLIDGGLDAQGFDRTDTRTYVDRPITIGDGAWIGAGAIILPGVTVGARSMVGAGSVVTKDVAPRSVVAGNPAELIRMIGAAD